MPCFVSSHAGAAGTPGSRPQARPSPSLACGTIRSSSCFSRPSPASSRLRLGGRQCSRPPSGQLERRLGLGSPARRCFAARARAAATAGPESLVVTAGRAEVAAPAAALGGPTAARAPVLRLATATGGGRLATAAWGSWSSSGACRRAGAVLAPSQASSRVPRAGVHRAGVPAVPVGLQLGSRWPPPRGLRRIIAESPLLDTVTWLSLGAAAVTALHVSAPGKGSARARPAGDSESDGLGPFRRQAGHQARRPGRGSAPAMPRAPPPVPGRASCSSESKGCVLARGSGPEPSGPDSLSKFTSEWAATVNHHGMMAASRHWGLRVWARRLNLGGGPGAQPPSHCLGVRSAAIGVPLIRVTSVSHCQ
jgi:hypothetical protein